MSCKQWDAYCATQVKEGTTPVCGWEPMEWTDELIESAIARLIAMRKTKVVYGWVPSGNEFAWGCWLEAA